MWLNHRDDNQESKRNLYSSLSTEAILNLLEERKTSAPEKTWELSSKNYENDQKLILLELKSPLRIKAIKDKIYELDKKIDDQKNIIKDHEKIIEDNWNVWSDNAIRSANKEIERIQWEKSANENLLTRIAKHVNIDFIFTLTNTQSNIWRVIESQKWAIWVWIELTSKKVTNIIEETNWQLKLF